MATIKELSKLINEQSEVIGGLKNSITAMESNMAAMKTEYIRKIEDLQLKLTTSSESTSTATLNAVTAFYNTVDNKVDQLLVEQDILKVKAEKNKERSIANKAEVVSLSKNVDEMSVFDQDQMTKSSLYRKNEALIQRKPVQRDSSTGVNLSNAEEHWHDSHDNIPETNNTSLQNYIPGKNIEELNQQIKAIIKDVDDLKYGLNHMSGETTAINKRLTEENVYKYRQVEDMNKLAEKSHDLEDRSRRDNLVFFNIEENEDSIENWQDCEKKVLQIVNDKILKGSEAVCLPLQIARAHRIGVYNKNKTRPIIVKFENHKIKQIIVEESREYNKGKERDDPTRVPISEDYCKSTQEIRKQLVIKMKYAKEACTKITGGFLKYKHLVLIYGEGEGTMRQTFSLDTINQNPRWYLPKPKPAY